MSVEKKVVELKEEDLEKVSGGVVPFPDDKYPYAQLNDGCAICPNCKYSNMSIGPNGMMLWSSKYKFMYCCNCGHIWDPKA